MQLQDHYTKQIKEYVLLTLTEIKALKNHALMISNKNDVVRVKINGKVKTWKRDINRFAVPVKYGLYEYGTITNEETKNLFVKEI